MTVSGSKRFSVVDLFSGGGGMSFGFHTHQSFKIVGAADAQLGKPSSPRGSLNCNSTYEMNMGVAPVEVDLGVISPRELMERMGVTGPIDVLSACPPCTGFSRTNSSNHIVDDQRNNLVRRVGDYVKVFEPKVLVMENARELLTGNFRSHFLALEEDLKNQGYIVSAGTHLLNMFGLPQLRERALVVAVRAGLTPRTIDALWDGFIVDYSATTVRHAIAHLPPVAAGETDPHDASHVSPSFTSSDSVARLSAIPADGGSWRDLVGDSVGESFLTPAMRRLVQRGKMGSHPDVYGRMAWNKPAPTVKRECGHIGNGRYSHPEQDRLCTLREMSILTGFPKDYKFGGSSLANRYRHVGDSVPPLISYQIAASVYWTLTGRKPNIEEIILPNSSLEEKYIHKNEASF